MLLKYGKFAVRVNHSSLTYNSISINFFSELGIITAIFTWSSGKAHWHWGKLKYVELTSTLAGIFAFTDNM